MISGIKFLEEQMERPRATTSAYERRNWALQRIHELKKAFASGRIDAKTYNARLRYWMKVSSGSPASPVAAQAGVGPSIDELRSAGTFF